MAMFDHCHAGFDHHLVKPIDTRQLIELLAEFARHDPRRRPVTRWPLKANRDNS
jgi:YesN/AraC family two-component response regulator